MNYNQNLKDNLQDWISRLENTHEKYFGRELTFLFDKLESSSICNTLIQTAVTKYPFSTDDFYEIRKDLGLPRAYSFSSLEELASFNYQLLKHHSDQFDSILYLTDFQQYKSSTSKHIIELHIKPIINFLLDNINDVNYTIYLIEKYKKRIEWFKRNELMKSYDSVKKSGEYEKVFEDDLRLFLFDQGVDYPFSTPQSPSGRADIIGNIETNDPLVIEIKLLAESKGYGKSRIKDGFSQIIRYTKDYNKQFGYLVLFNLDNIEYQFELSEKNQTLPKLIVNDKVYYIVVINLYNEKTASKSGKTNIVSIKESDLITSPPPSA